MICCPIVDNRNQMSIRWFFNASKWRPTKDEWLSALPSIQSEELSRINAFVFKNDTKLALIGRLLMRSCAQKYLKSVDYKDIRFGRTESGKPFIAEPLITDIDINISHSGDYCVVAADNSSKVGVDVMKIEYSGQTNDRPLNDFFRLMNKQFSKTEWVFINFGSNDWQKLSRFIRLWTLKESYVKAVGTGISSPLNQISFQCLTPDLKVGKIISDSKVTVNNQLLDEWVFEESLIDDKHCVSVAFERNQCRDNLDSQQLVFKEITIKDLLEEAVPLDENKNVDHILWQQFVNKPIKKFN